jgi:hypothetical protein
MTSSSRCADGRVIGPDGMGWVLIGLLPRAIGCWKRGRVINARRPPMMKIAILVTGVIVACSCSRGPATPRSSRYEVRIYQANGDTRRGGATVATIPVSPVCSDSGGPRTQALIWRDRNRPARSCWVASVPWPALADGAYLLGVENLGTEVYATPFVIEGGHAKLP